jgi:hypothetical protein
MTVEMMRRLFRWFGLLFLLPLLVHAIWWTANDPAHAWNEADWSSARLLAPATRKSEAIVHVYAARVGRWRGIFADHTWIVVKEKGASGYTRYDKTFWGNPVKTNQWAPDARWYGHTPRLVGAVEGAAAEAAIPKVRQAVARYPFARPGGYFAWPGPNSNSFVAHILRSVPELGIAMPPTAVGKDFRTDGTFFGRTPSGTGYELSIYGLIGATLARVEGFELSILGATVGIDVFRPAIKLPGFGRIGLPAV